MVASNRGSVAKFEDQMHGKDTNFDDTFTRDDKGLASSLSQPVIQSNAMPNYGYFDDNGIDYSQSLKYLYPEPGLRDTFVEGVYIDSHPSK
mmetsp:Transcript_8735/g.9925  ORF Transcript_8735/g.9925 Transcript_8735/m.9925 type:complete len:91 (-) Transcript_8735:16-288(-)